LFLLFLADSLPRSWFRWVVFLLLCYCPAASTGALWNKRGITLSGVRLCLGGEHATFIANFQQVTHFLGGPHNIQMSFKYM
jgi:hypothetical protein